MKKTSLVIMAAGIGSHFGGIKQLAPVGPSGEIIMDYSIHDALEAGFDKIIFIIRKDLEKDFKGDHRKPYREDRSGRVCVPGDGRSPGEIFCSGRKKEAVGNRSGDPCGEKFN